MNHHALGIAALLFGVVALGFAVIPGIALDRPFPFADKERDAPAPREPEAKGGVTLQFKDMSVTFGGDKESEEDQEQRAIEAANKKKKASERDWLLKGFTIAAVSCSLLGLILGPLSWVREKQPAIAGAAMGICCVAILWQYIVFGIVVGLAIGLILLVLSQF